MRARLPSLRRRATGDTPVDAAPTPSPDQPVAWSAEDPAAGPDPLVDPPEASTAPGSGGPPGVLDAAGTPPAEPETTVFPAVADDGSSPAPEPATTAFPHAPTAPVVSVPDATVLPPPDPSAPAGTEPASVEAPPEPSFRIRGRLRRRLRYLRRVRELGLRDLGGLLLDLHRFGRDGEVLIAGKLAALTTVDDEVRALEVALDDRHELTVLREPGISACPRCAALHGSDANFCPICGLGFAGAHRVLANAPLPPPLVAPGPDPVTAAHLHPGEPGRPR
jgi:hypothetical protein